MRNGNLRQTRFLNLINSIWLHNLSFFELFFLFVFVSLTLSIVKLLSHPIILKFYFVSIIRRFEKENWKIISSNLEKFLNTWKSIYASYFWNIKKKLFCKSQSWEGQNCFTFRPSMCFLFTNSTCHNYLKELLLRGWSKAYLFSLAQSTFDR